MRQRAQQSLTPVLVDARQRPPQLIEGLAPLGLGLGIDQIGEPLGRRQVQFAVLEGPPGELPGLGHSQPIEPRQCAGDRLDGGAPAVDMQFGHVFAGKTRRPRKPNRQPIVEGIARVRVAKAHSPDPASRQQIDTAESRKGHPRLGPRYPENRHPGTAGGGRKRKNSFGCH